MSVRTRWRCPWLLSPWPHSKYGVNIEFDDLIKNNTWELVPHPPNVNGIQYVDIPSQKEIR